MCITDIEIRETLNKLSELYDRMQQSTDDIQTQEHQVFHSILYSKISILEFCGWLEDTHDLLILSVIKRHLPENEDSFKKDHIKNIYGFEYKKHFKKMLIDLLGYIVVTQLEKEIPNVMSIDSMLSDIKKKRDFLAHTQCKNQQWSSDAPSKVISDLNKIYPILKEIEKFLNKIDPSLMICTEYH